MKKKSILYILAGMAMVAISCNDFLDVNENPNQPTSATPETVLSNALSVSAGRLVHHEIGAFWSGQWSPSGSVSGFTPEKTYDIQTTFRTGIWTSPYNNLTDYQYVEDQALAKSKFAIAGMALVMKAFNYQVLVDAYGNVPYSDALKGTTSIRPAYDDGKAVYDSLIRDINLGITYLSKAITSENASPGQFDIYFGGDTAKWIRFANTLKLRMLIRISNVPDKAALVSSEMAKFGSGPTVFLDSAEDVRSNPGFLKTAGKENPWYETYGFQATDSRAGNHDFYCWSDFFIKKLESTKDSLRMKLMTYPVGGGGNAAKKLLGVPFGEGSDTYLYSKISGFGPAFLPLDGASGTVSSSTLYKRDQIVMTASESLLLQAEAVQRGLLASSRSVKQLYDKGVGASFALLATSADTTNNGAVKSAWTNKGKSYNLKLKQLLSAYLNSGLANNTDFNAATDKLEAIRLQKWIALANYSGWEAWTEWRRTGVPKDLPLSTRALGNQMPVRLLYPLSEYSNNTDNAQAQGTINQFTSKIFWIN